MHLHSPCIEHHTKVLKASQGWTPLQKKHWVQRRAVGRTRAGQIMGWGRPR